MGELLTVLIVMSLYTEEVPVNKSNLEFSQVVVYQAPTIEEQNIYDNAMLERNTILANNE